MMNPHFHTDFSISDSLIFVRKSVLIYETIIMYARYERGANELPIRHLIKLCQYYHVSADYFLGLSKYINKKGKS